VRTRLFCRRAGFQRFQPALREETRPGPPVTAPDLRFSLRTQFSYLYRRVVLRLPENSGLPYVIEASGDLVNWLPVATNANAWSTRNGFTTIPPGRRSSSAPVWSRKPPPEPDPTNLLRNFLLDRQDLNKNTPVRYGNAIRRLHGRPVACVMPVYRGAIVMVQPLLQGDGADGGHPSSAVDSGRHTPEWMVYHPRGALSIALARLRPVVGSLF
jgi:hypothetical protein